MNISFRSMEMISQFFKDESSYTPIIMRILSNQNVYRQKARFMVADVFKKQYKLSLSSFLLNKN